MIPRLRRQEALDGANFRSRGRSEDERVAVARVLPFCPSSSWYISYWHEEAHSPGSASLFGRFNPPRFPVRRKTSGVVIANGDTVPVRTTTDRSRVICRRLAPAALISLQLAGLWALNFAGFWVIQKTALPIPGNLIGMLTLFALLVTGVVKVAWFDLTGSFLIKHLAFFFVPITVGLMNAGPLLLVHGLGIILVLTISAAIGILLAGFVSQGLLARPWRTGDQL